MKNSSENYIKEKFPSTKRRGFTILQANLGYKCNQTCVHCHVNAGPHRKEMMKSENIDLIPKILSSYNIQTLDLTGGAPELHPKFKELVMIAKSLGTNVIDRCNLTILSEPFQEDLANFLASNNVIITASLPCYEKDNVDRQRGEGVFKRSIDGLKKLNSLGYGQNDSNLELNLVYNPQGANLPPSQEKLERTYKRELLEKYKIRFTNLYTITNMPIKRFAFQLNCNGQLDSYINLLKESHNPVNIDSIMCKDLISVDWEGNLYDCDFNQQLGNKINGNKQHLKDLLRDKESFSNSFINVGDHCFGCTAGHGSSCGGSFT